MASTNFINGTVIQPSWLNDVNTAVYNATASITGATTRTAVSKFAELVSVTDFGADMSGTTDSSRAVYNTQVYAQANNKKVYIPEGTLLAAIDVHYNNASIIGAGSSVTTIKLPISTVAITSISTAANILTVICASTSNIWVGKSVKIQGTTAPTHNSGFIVTSVDSATQFKCSHLNDVVTGTSTGGSYTAANIIDLGELCHGNSANEYTGIVISGVTLDGQRASRTTPGSDLTDWGIGATKYSNITILDVYSKNCWQGGIGIFINSNYSTIDARVENCGFSTQSPAGFDVNSSKYMNFRVVTKDCNYGVRLLDNCWSINGIASINNSTITGLVVGNQSVNESHNINVTATIEDGCTSVGAQLGINLQSCSFNITTSDITGIGVEEVYTATAAQQPRNTTYIINTRNSGSNGVRIGGNFGTWFINSNQDGRSGAAGSSYAIVVNGQENTYTATVTDSSTPQVRGIFCSSTSSGNNLLSFKKSTLVSNYMDSGTNNRFERIPYTGSKTYDAPSLAAGGSTSTTITVVGAAAGRGDIANVRYNANIGGIIIYAEVTGTDTVTAWLYNPTAAPIDLASGTIYATVEAGTP